MKFSFDTKKHGNINDNAVRDLPLGKNNFQIVKVEVVAVKADKSGKRKQICVSLKHHTGQPYTYFIEITEKDLGPSATQEKKDGEAMRARIAAETFNALVQAAGFTGVLTVPKFKLLKDKVVGIETAETKNGEKTYINVRAIGAPFEIADTSDDADEDEDEEEESDEEEPNEFDDSEEDDDEEEEEEEDESDAEREEREAEEALQAKKAKAAALKKKKAAALKKKKADEAAAAEDDDDDDEEEDEEEDGDDPW
mgnify:CR=1 FL=1|tara:strand:+ start:10367 stop:11125 length:759 start_codon:yes stop_codon:yes gene_type:complete